MVSFRKNIIDLQKKDIKITLTLSAISTSFTRFYSTFYTSFSLRDAMQWLHIWLALCIAYITANLYQLGNQVKHNAIPSLWRSWFFEVKIKQLSKTALWKKVGLRIEFVKSIQAKTGTVSVHRLLKRFEKDGSMDRWPGSERPVTVTMGENEELVGDLICSQKENPGTHLSPQEIWKVTGISQTSVRRMVKRRGLRQFKRIKTSRMSSATQQWWTERAEPWQKNFRKKINRKMCMAGQKGFYSGCSLQCSEQSCLWYG